MTSGVKKAAALFGAVVLALIALAAVKAISMGIKTAQIAQVLKNTPPLTISKVEDLLGRPDHIEHAEATGITGDTYYYGFNTDHLRVIFINGVELKADFNSALKT